MLNIPEELKELFRADLSAATQRHLKLRFYDGKINLPENTLFYSEEISLNNQDPIYEINNTQILSESLTITESLCTSQNLIFGQCCASMFEITVADVLMDLTGKEFMVTVEIGGYEMILGIYKVDSFVREQADRRRKKITAYDRMMNFDIDVADWYQGLSFPLSLKQFRDSLCQYIGITQVTASLPLDDMQLTKTIEPDQLDGRKVLMAICEINGCFGNFDKSGNLTYKFLGFSGLFPSETLYPSDDLFPSEMTNAENLSHYQQSETYYEDFVTKPINKVQIRQEEGDVGASYGPGDNCYIVQGNFLVYGKSGEELLTIAATVYEQISRRTYKPSHIVGPALPWVEVGDGIICYTTDDVVETYCFERTLKGIQGMMDTYESKGSIEQEQSFGLGDQIIQLEGKTAIIKKSVEEVSVRVTDLKKQTDTQFIQTAEQILLEVTRAKQAEASLSLRADEIGFSVKNLKDYTEGQFRVTADQILAKVSKGDVSAQISIESGGVDIRGSRFSWDSAYSSMTSDGKLRCQNVVAINGVFSGTLSSETFYASSSEVDFGDFYVSAGGSNVLRSNNGFFRVNSQGPSSGSPGGDYSSVFIGGQGYGGVTINGVGTIDAGGSIQCADVYIRDGWTEGWGLLRMLKDIYNRIRALEG